MNKKIDVYNVINNLFRMFIVSSVIFVLKQKNYEKLGFLAIAFSLTFIDKIVKKLLKIELSTSAKLSILALNLTAECLGSVYDFYGRFVWWDTVIHGVSGTIFFYIGMELIGILNKRITGKDINVIIQIIFAICFSLSIGVIWELFEFGVDKFLGKNMQDTRAYSGQDAIWDTILDLLSATLGTIVGTVIESFKYRINKKEKGKN